ncbi:CLUMA_CG021328, isoform A [Clunio marinus]|uniref:CLUMA_CG021328, isoform A n=1 Tax=Clunio marinus TaxID=568069 RepID=A0A1J1J929_9DIPT|nr:CLUMA_CG021328, isoform A [Clunio marinus]
MSEKLLSILVLLMVSSGEVLSQGYICSGLWQGEIVANPNDCTKFYSCVLFIPVTIDCPQNQVFDRYLLKCVPGNPETCEIFGSSSTTTAPTLPTTPITPIASTTPNTPTPEITSTVPITPTQGTTTSSPIDPVDLDEICRGVFFEALPYPNSLEHYVGCIRGSGVVFKCYEDEFFHPVIHECLQYPTTEESTTPETTTTTRFISTTLAPSLEGICEGKFFDYIAHPTACALYIFCYEELFNIRQCPEFQIWNDSDKTCQSGNRVTCELTVENTLPITEPTTPEPVTTPETTTSLPVTLLPTSTVVYNPCDGVSSGSVPDPQDCTKYFRCVSEIPITSQCTAGQIFSAQRMLCVTGNSETCQPSL